jgi:phage major head subunit gpT-like protein
MLINKANISEVFENIRATFNQALDAAETMYQDFATVLDTSQIVEKMDWVGQLPNWREWVGDKVVNNLAAHTYSLTCLEYESTIAVKRRDLEADRLGIYKTQAMSQGELAAYFPEERCGDALNNAFTALCWDGKAMFATDHVGETKAGKATTFSNKGTAVLSASTQALAIASLGAGLTALRSMKNHKGRPVRVRNIQLVVPPALADIANILATSTTLDDGKANPFKGVVTVKVWPELTSATAWFLLGESGGLKPLILVQRKKPTTAEVTDPNDSHVVNTGQFLFSIEADAVAGYTFPQLGYGSTGAG